MKLLINKCGEELYLFIQPRAIKKDWIIDTVCDIDDINMLLARIYEKIKGDENGD